MGNYNFRVFPEPFWADNRPSPNPFFRPKGQKPEAAKEPDTTQNITPAGPMCPPQCPPMSQPICPPVFSPIASPMVPPVYPPIAPPGFDPQFPPQCPPQFPPCPEPMPFYQQPPYSPVFAPLSMRLAHAYVPWQYYNVVYGTSEALDKGTLFPELFQPQGVYGHCEGPQPCGGVYYDC